MSKPPQRALFVVLGVGLALLGSSAARAATPGEATELRVTGYASDHLCIASPGNDPNVL